MSRAWTPLPRAYRTRGPYGLRLIGEVGTTVLDVSELSFADAGAASALARARRDAPSAVRLVGCRPAPSSLLDPVDGAGGAA
ncbi:hypothetical protein E1193_14385 [Micromonospora sp. KC606]|uniref:hypothetical protein n=1 Tax=Micromonospora sp. KC606 TaxID=2530379 RepID=UPI00104B36BD|nr:hypothetical protein [Micromonospora sp. KC606]TDC81561.1 hypothetical protein E1193_14385 [Micromonospora sp. KC606]